MLPSGFDWFSLIKIWIHSDTEGTKKEAFALVPELNDRDKELAILFSSNLKVLVEDLTHIVRNFLSANQLLPKDYDLVNGLKIIRDNCEKLLQDEPQPEIRRSLNIAMQGSYFIDKDELDMVYFYCEPYETALVKIITTLKSKTNESKSKS